MRVGLRKLVKNSVFEGFIYHMIAFNSLLLMLDTPELEDPFQKDTIKLAFNIISGFFVVEMLLKIVVQGFYWGSKTYLKDHWNKLDFLIVLSSILTWIFEFVQLADVHFFRAFRVLRALRPLRVVKRHEGIKTVVNAFLKSIPTLMNVVLIILMVMLVYGILGVQLFQGMLSSCNDPDPLIELKSQCVGQFNQSTVDPASGA